MDRFDPAHHIFCWKNLKASKADAETRAASDALFNISSRGFRGLGLWKFIYIFVMVEFTYEAFSERVSEVSLCPTTIFNAAQMKKKSAKATLVPVLWLGFSKAEIRGLTLVPFGF